MNIPYTPDENYGAAYNNNSIPVCGFVAGFDLAGSLFRPCSDVWRKAQQTMPRQVVQSISLDSGRPLPSQPGRRTSAARLAAWWLVLACVCQAHDVAAEAGRGGNGIRFTSEVQELPPASSSEQNQPAALAPSPAPAPEDESIQPGVPQRLQAGETLQQDAQSLEAGQGELPPIQTLSINIQPPPGELPENSAAAMFARHPTIIVPPAQPGPELKYTGWPRISGICNQPLYFEEPAAERYGITRPLQPVRSAAHFYGSAFVLPVKLALHPPRELVCNENYSPNPNRPWLRRHPIIRRTVSTGQAITYTAIFLMP
jgi:hypothetical protein